MRYYSLSFLSKDRHRLDRNRQWCDRLASKKNYEIAIHGYTHKSIHRPDSAEFNLLDSEEINFRLNEAETIFQTSGLPFVKGFRQPGWLAPECLPDILRERKYLFWAGSMDILTPVSKTAVCNQSGFKGFSLIYPQQVKGLVHIPSNIGLDHLDINRALEITQLDGLISVKAHMAYWDENGITPQKITSLDSFLTKLEESRVEYTTMEAIARKLEA